MRFYAIGGFNEVGKNMIAIEVGNSIVIVDMGVDVERLSGLDDDEELSFITATPGELRERMIIPDDTFLDKKRVVGIVLSHGHLDHIAAVPVLAGDYNAPIIGTPFTIELVKQLLEEHNKMGMVDRLVKLDYGRKYDLSSDVSVELVRMTHSIPQPAMVILHTREGIVAVAYDYKLDNTPTMGQKPDYKRLRELAEEGIKLLVIETVHIYDEERTPSEKVADIMVYDAIDRAYEETDSAVFVTTFASHIARIKSIINANRGRREVMLLGRSMKRYTDVAQKLGMMDLSSVRVASYTNEIKKAFRDLERDPGKYLVVCTGNQGEINAVLSRLARGEYPYKLRKEDQVIFASKAIPTPTNIASRYELKQHLKDKGVRILDNVHVSGHAMREDHRDLIRLLKPEYIIPCHGDTERLASMASLAEEEGYVIGSTVRILTNGRYTTIK